MLVAVVANAAINPGENVLSGAIANASPGDVIELNSGDFTETAVFDIAKDITIKAAAGKVPVVKPKGIGIMSGAKVIFDSIKIDCSAATDHVIYANDDSDDKSFTLEGCEVYGFTNNSSVIYTEQKFDTCIINNCVLRNIEKSIIFYNGGSGKYVSITNSTLANITPTSESSYWTAVIYPTTATKVKIDHCTFYNCYSMGSYGTINLSASDVVVSNCILAMPADKDKRCIYNSGGNVMNCLTHHYTKSGTLGGIAPGPTITGCTEISNVDPKFAGASTGNFLLAEDSPAHEAGVGGTHLGDPNNWPDSWQPAADVPVTSITIDKKTLSLDVNETFYLHTTVLPNNASDPTVTWTSKDEAKATVINGAVKGIAAGEVKIIAQAGEKTDTCTVTVSDTIPEFASPYFFMGTKAQLAGYISVNEADSLHYNDRSNPGTATWKINVTAPCFINATANFKTGSASGAKLRVVILDSEDAQVGDSLMQDYHDEDGDLAFTGSIALPKAGIYTVKLVNIQSWSSSKLRGITLTKDASKDVVFKGAWDEWALHPATTIAADGSSASVKVVLPANDYEFGVTLGGDFRANGWWLKPEGPTTAEGITGNTGTNMKVCPAFNLEHTFTWTYATNAVTVTFPEVTVYFVNESDWATVKAYAWRGDVKNADWSGEVLEPTGTKSEGHDVYAYDASAYKNIIFNDGGSNKTGDLDVDPAKPYYYAGDWHETLPGAPTAIDNTVVGEKAVKLMENGQIVIIKNGVHYNVLGTVIK